MMLSYCVLLVSHLSFFTNPNPLSQLFFFSNVCGKFRELECPAILLSTDLITLGTNLLFNFFFTCKQKDHLESCPLKPVSCTNQNCHVSIARKGLREHVTTTCEWRIIPCTYCNTQHPACETEVKIFICNDVILFN